MTNLAEKWEIEIQVHIRAAEASLSLGREGCDREKALAAEAEVARMRRGVQRIFMWLTSDRENYDEDTAWTEARRIARGLLAGEEETVSDQVRLWDTLEEALKPIARRSREDAEDVYRALCNVAWIPLDHPAETYNEWSDGWSKDSLNEISPWLPMGVSMSWRYAGEFVAELRREGEDYMDFYCSGREGAVTEEIRKTLEEKGLRPLV